MFGVRLEPQGQEGAVTAGSGRTSNLRPLGVLLFVALVFAFVPSSRSAAYRLPDAPRCRIFPKNNHWNLRVDDLPVLENSDEMVATIGLDEGLHADFGSGRWEGAPIGIPVNVVPRDQPRVPVRFEYADESDRGPYPVPRHARIEGGADSDGDRHVIIVDKGRCRLHELFAAYPRRGGARWRAGSGAIWNLDSNRLRPRYWTSADAAGLPILPGLARYSDVRKGRINHALRFTVSRTRRAFIYPARHYASDSDNPNLPAMGQRLRLKAAFDISDYPRQARIVLRALKQFGMIVADNGSDWYITGAPAPRWNNDALQTLGTVTGDNFEVVDTSLLPRP